MQHTIEKQIWHLKQLFRKGSGFTFIELLISFSIISLLSAAGAIAFVSYNKSQVLTQSANEIAQAITIAKSRAQSQVKPLDCKNATLVGYEFRVCGVGFTCNNTQNDYEVVAVCSGTPQFVTVIPSSGSIEKLPSGVSFNTSSIGAIRFEILTGGVTGAKTLTLTGPDGKTKTITVDNRGNIDNSQ